MNEKRVTVFPRSPILRAVDAENWRLMRDYSDRHSGIYIRRGFLFDGASIPRALWRVCGHPMRGDILPAALIHDAMYGAQLVTRADADQWFRSNLELLGMGSFHAFVFYSAVRAFGWIAWNKNKDGIQRVRKLISIEDKK